MAAPRVLDEGIDVPDANLGIVMSASRTRRQMIQRMGRILRRKRAGVGARFVIMFAKDTLEDPAARIERDGFLDEIERISEAATTFDATNFEEVSAFLTVPGPATVVEPRRVGPFHSRPAAVAGVVEAPPRESPLGLLHGDAAAWAAQAGACEALTAEPDATGELVDQLARRIGFERLYAVCSFLRWDVEGALHRAVWERAEARLPVAADRTLPYLELELTEVPVVSKPRVPPKKLSAGQAPLEIATDGTTWHMRCTGCGGLSPSVRFRWQVLEQTVDCRCG